MNKFFQRLLLTAAGLLLIGTAVSVLADFSVSQQKKNKEDSPVSVWTGSGAETAHHAENEFIEEEEEEENENHVRLRGQATGSVCIANSSVFSAAVISRRNAERVPEPRLILRI